MPRNGKEKSPIEIFSGSDVRPNLEHLHPFGCPVYVLRDKLQNGQKVPKWELRARCGIYIGPSPHHATSVGLILSNETGIVSPQFHCIYDDLFETTKTDDVTSKWQGLANFDQPQPSDYDPSQKLLPIFDFKPSFTGVKEGEGEVADDDEEEDDTPHFTRSKAKKRKKRRDTTFLDDDLYFGTRKSSSTTTTVTTPSASTTNPVVSALLVNEDHTSWKELRPWRKSWPFIFCRNLS